MQNEPTSEDQLIIHTLLAQNYLLWDFKICRIGGFCLSAHKSLKLTTICDVTVILRHIHHFDVFRQLGFLRAFAEYLRNG